MISDSSSSRGPGYPAYPLLPTPTTAEVVLIPVPGSNHQYSIVALLEIH